MLNNFNNDIFVRNPPNPVDTYKFSEHESLFTTLNSSPIPNSFNISSFNVNGLRHNSQVKIEQISNFFNLKHISFGGIVDTHLSLKQIHFLSKRLPNYTVFSSDLDNTKQVKSTGGVSLFIEKSLASHVQDFVSHSSQTIDLLLQLLVQTKQQNFYHAICGDFNMHLDTYYPIYFNRPSVASQRAYRLLHHLLSHGYKETLPVNASDSLGIFHRDDQVTRIDYVWSCPMLKSFALTSYIFDAQDTCSFDHNPVITYFDDSLLVASIKVARAKQLQRRTRRIFKFDSVSAQQWDSFSTHVDSLCDVPPSTFSTWHINQQCEYLQSHSSIRAKLDDRDNNFETDISTFINSALSRTRRRITLDRVFIDHPTQPKLLTDPHDINDAVIKHFQTSVPIKSSPPDNISAFPERWFSAYRPMDDVDFSIYDSLLDPPTLEEWLSTVSSMPNDKAPGPSMITYEMLKHLGANTSALVLILVQSCLRTADIPDL
ncbi:hypothetical protein GLOIN_2v1786555 [Rhizophagus irregularis DAOM 181602=DAOM 197198]|nr:hypothetical protein GLOIN_2v1786555 [Rhizophagus irregularis DAOM 181602=DAOM 197198]